MTAAKRFHYFLRADIVGYACDVRLNGFSLVNEWRGPRTGIIPVNLWMVPGDNTFEVTLHAEGWELASATRSMPCVVDGEEVLRDVPRWVDAALCLEHDPVDGALTEGRTDLLAHLLRHAGEDGLEADDLPVTTTVRFAHDLPFGRWRWQDGAEVTLDDPEEATLRTFLGEVRGWIEEGAVDDLMTALAIPIEERGRAFGVSTEDVRADLAGHYTRLFENPDFALRSVDLDRARFVPHCDGRVVEVLDDQGLELFRQDDDLGDDAYWVMPLYLGKLDGAWRIVAV